MHKGKKERSNMNIPSLSNPTPVSCWRLENTAARIAVEKTTGLIRGCTWRQNGVDLFQQVRGGIPGYIGGLRVYDEHDRVMYSDLDSKSSVRNLKKRGQSASFEKAIGKERFYQRDRMCGDPESSFGNISER
jgi:hypothetical protein